MRAIQARSTVPAVVLTTRRAWALTEAAHARGLDSPYKPTVAPLRANCSLGTPKKPKPGFEPLYLSVEWLIRSGWAPLP